MKSIRIVDLILNENNQIKKPLSANSMRITVFYLISVGNVYLRIIHSFHMYLSTQKHEIPRIFGIFDCLQLVF